MSHDTWCIAIWPMPLYTLGARAHAPRRAIFTCAVQVLNEIKVVFNAASDHLVAFYDAFFHDGAVHLALEYMDCGSLEVVLRVVGQTQARVLPEGMLSAVVFQSLQGLIYARLGDANPGLCSARLAERPAFTSPCAQLHRERKTCHRDLKPANILLDSSGFVKLSDFGISKVTALCGSPTNSAARLLIGCSNPRTYRSWDPTPTHRRERSAAPSLTWRTSLRDPTP